MIMNTSFVSTDVKIEVFYVIQFSYMIISFSKYIILKRKH